MIEVLLTTLETEMLTTAVDQDLAEQTVDQDLAKKIKTSSAKCIEFLICQKI